MKKPLLSEMTLREKIGQCLLVYQYEINQNPETNYKTDRTQEERRAVLEKEQLGVFYGEQVDSYDKRDVDLSDKVRVKVNSTKYKKFIDEQCQMVKIPPLVTADCEYGAGSIFEDLSSVCGPLSVGSVDSEELAFEFGAAVARELRCGGINWRWTPIIDLVNRRSNGIMRNFAPGYPERMAALSIANFKGMQSEGVAATAKHFPGSDGYEYRDSHLCPTMVRDSKEKWWKKQGKYFKQLIDSGVYSVMIGHQAFPAVDDTKIGGKFIPSTLSKKVITDLLKEEMGFGGVVVTDGITMGGLFSLLSYEDLIVMLINAGNDVILGAKMCSGEILEKAVRDGRVDEKRIDDACQRVLDMKEKIGLFDDNYYNYPYTSKDVVPKTRQINTEIARKSITLVRDRTKLLPMKKENIKRVTIIVSSHLEEFEAELEPMKKAFEERGATVKMKRRLASADELKEISDNSDLIVYAVYVAGHCPVGGSTLFGDEAYTYFHAFKYGKEKSIGAAFGYPYIHFDIMENADAFINAYGKNPDSQTAFVEAVYGDIEIVGKSPIVLEPDLTKE